MQMFEMGVAFRGSAAPEVKRFVEAESMRDAICKVTEQFGGGDVALVTYAQYSLPPEAPMPRREPANSFMIAPPTAA